MFLNQTSSPLPNGFSPCERRTCWPAEPPAGCVQPAPRSAPCTLTAVGTRTPLLCWTGGWLAASSSPAPCLPSEEQTKTGLEMK